jgi:hypothetical protein
LRQEVSAAVGREIAERGLEPLDRLEAARYALWSSVRAMRTEDGRA